MDERADGSAADGSTAAGTGRGRAALIEGDAEFDGRDAALLRAVHEAGSVAGAASELGRSRARALLRIEALEGAFGTLVERRAGGSGGGGSRLTGPAATSSTGTTACKRCWPRQPTSPRRC